MSSKKEEYQAYLLRLWQVSNKDKPRWRASLQCIGDGELRVFSSLRDLFAFLEMETNRGQDKNKGE